MFAFQANVLTEALSKLRCIDALILSGTLPPINVTIII